MSRVINSSIVDFSGLKLDVILKAIEAWSLRTNRIEE